MDSDVSCRVFAADSDDVGVGAGTVAPLFLGAVDDGQGRSGRRKVNRANEDTPIIGCTVADVIGVAMEDEHGRLDRGIAASLGRRHPVSRDGESEGFGAEDPQLSVGELVIGYASPEAEMDHDLLRRDLFYGSTRASWGRQTNSRYIEYRTGYFCSRLSPNNGVHVKINMSYVPQLGIKMCN